MPKLCTQTRYMDAYTKFRICKYASDSYAQQVPVQEYSSPLAKAKAATRQPEY